MIKKFLHDTIFLLIIFFIISCSKDMQTGFIAINNIANSYKIDYSFYKERDLSSDNIVKFGFYEYPSSFNPFRAISQSEFFLKSALFSSLFIESPNSSEIMPNIAEKCKITDEGRNYQIKIRNNVMFSNGKLLTTKDVQATFDVVKKFLYKTELYNKFYIRNKMLEINIKDDFNFELLLDVPNSNILFALTQLPILDCNEVELIKDYEGFILNWAKNNTLSTTGPYKIKRISTESIELEANTAYFKSYNDNTLPNTKNIIMKFYPNKSEMILGFCYDEIDVLLVDNDEDYKTLYDFFEPTVNKVKIIDNGIDTEKTFIVYNSFSDKAKNFIVDTSCRAYISNSILSEIADKSTISAGFSSIMHDYSNNISNISDISSFIDNTNDTTVDIKLLSIEDCAVAKKISMSIAETLKKNNFNVSLKLCPFSDYIEQLFYEKDFDIAVVRFNIDDTPYSVINFLNNDLSFYPFFNKDDKSQAVLTLSNEIDYMLSETKIDKINTRINNIYKIMSDNRQFTPVFHNKIFYFIKNDISNFYIKKNSKFINMSAIENIF